MTTLKYIRTSIFTIGILLTINGYSQRPYNSPLEGEINKGSFDIGGCRLASLTAKYRLSTLAGEPIVFVNIKWQPLFNSSHDCLENEKFHLLLKIYSGQTSSYYYLLADGALGIIPDGNNTYGYNPIAGSPNWDELFMRYPSKNPNTNDWNYISAEQAKRIWSHEFQVSGIEFVESAEAKEALEQEAKLKEEQEAKLREEQEAKLKEEQEAKQKEENEAIEKEKEEKKALREIDDEQKRNKLEQETNEQKAKLQGEQIMSSPPSQSRTPEQQRMDEIEANYNAHQAALEQENIAKQNYINEMSKLASESVGSGEMDGEFILNGGYGLYNLSENGTSLKSSGSIYSLEAEYTHIKESGLYTRMRAAYTAGLADEFTSESEMNIECIQFAYGYGFAGDGISAILEAEYYNLNLSNSKNVRTGYAQNMVGLNISPFYGISTRDMESSLKIGLVLEPLLIVEDTQLGIVLGGYVEYKMNMLNVKLYYNSLNSTSESNPAVSSLEGYGLALGLRIPW